MYFDYQKDAAGNSRLTADWGFIFAFLVATVGVPMLVALAWP